MKKLKVNLGRELKTLVRVHGIQLLLSGTHNADPHPGNVVTCRMVDSPFVLWWRAKSTISYFRGPIISRVGVHDRVRYIFCAGRFLEARQPKNIAPPLSRPFLFLRFCCGVRFHVGIGMFHRADSLKESSQLHTSMARPPFVNPVTGRPRRANKRSRSKNSRWMHLGAQEVGTRKLV